MGIISSVKNVVSSDNGGVAEEINEIDSAANDAKETASEVEGLEKNIESEEEDILQAEKNDDASDGQVADAIGETVKRESKVEKGVDRVIGDLKTQVKDELDLSGKVRSTLNPGLMNDNLRELHNWGASSSGTKINNWPDGEEIAAGKLEDSLEEIESNLNEEYKSALLLSKLKNRVGASINEEQGTEELLQHEKKEIAAEEEMTSEALRRAESRGEPEAKQELQEEANYEDKEERKEAAQEEELDEVRYGLEEVKGDVEQEMQAFENLKDNLKTQIQGLSNLEDDLERKNGYNDLLRDVREVKGQAQELLNLVQKQL